MQDEIINNPKLYENKQKYFTKKYADPSIDYKQKVEWILLLMKILIKYGLGIKEK